MFLLFIRSPLLNAGYRVSFSHAGKNSLKTDAPNSFSWDVVCALKRRVDIEIQKGEAERDPAVCISKACDDKGDRGTGMQRKVAGKKKHPPSEESLRVAKALLERHDNPDVDLTPHPQANPPSRASGLLRLVVVTTMSYLCIRLDFAIVLGGTATSNYRLV